MIRSSRCVQLDPISVVARSPLLVLHSRLAGFRPAHLDRLLWEDHAVFEYWAHAASIVLTEDLPIHAWFMRSFMDTDGVWERRHREWLAVNAKLRRSILSRLRREGPLLSRQLADLSTDPWRSSGWTNDRNVDKMLVILWSQGKVTVAGRQGGQKLWDLIDRVILADAPRTRLSDLAVTKRAADLSLLGLGVGTAQHIKRHFTRGRYPKLAKALAAFERAKRVERVSVTDGGRALPGVWYLHAEHRETLERLEAGRWTPRTTMLSPFDNLIADRARALTLFDLDFKIVDLRPQAPAPLRVLRDAGARGRPPDRARRPRVPARRAAPRAERRARGGRRRSLAGCG